MEYTNYGDADFWEGGIFAANDQDCNTAYYIVRCEPYPDDNEGTCFLFGRLYVDISDSWIDRQAVMDYIGMTEDTFDPAGFAIGCTDYYPWENFGAEQMGAGFDWTHATREEILRALPDDITVD